MKNRTKGRLMIAILVFTTSFGFYYFGGVVNVLILWALWICGYLLFLYIVAASKLLSSDD